ncbi:MAG: hypothetical protein IBX44_02200 [Sulfurospirillum sp.]|nr:hypothetical protein [Sulfurospirillum sp.]
MGQAVTYSRCDISSIYYKRFEDGKSIEIETKNLDKCVIDNRFVKIVLQNQTVLEFLKQFMDIRLTHEQGL